ncbi:MarR family winged helix-turn-helix transcriptional regulator [Limosilactobacillus balticus]|uniref:MarR family winged helix-turn-helix transcriptional regulator n=2 Tax=Limosilactobacillus TaxID=2742598 RepID=UPI003992B7DE
MNNVEKWLNKVKSQKAITEKLENFVNRQSNGVNTLSEYYILNFLAQSPTKSLSQSEIIDKMPLSQSATSRVLSHLLAKNCGAIKRHQSPDDKRSQFLVITPIGEKIVTNLTPGIQKILQDI